MIIDAKGKIFGIINIIDLGVILGIIIFGYIFFNLARNAKLGYPIEIEANVLFPSVPLETVEKLQPGDMQASRYGRSRLIRFGIKKPYIEKDGNKAADIHARLKLSARVKDVPVGNRGLDVSGFFLNDRELNINDPVIFTTSKYSIRGILLNIGGMEREIEVALSYELPGEVIESIKIGDRVIRHGHEVGEVLAKEYTHDNKVRVRLHIKRGEISLKPGDQFPFETERYSVWGIIAESTPWEKN
jgi:hypothetical protein